MSGEVPVITWILSIRLSIHQTSGEVSKNYPFILCYYFTNARWLSLSHLEKIRTLYIFSVITEFMKFLQKLQKRSLVQIQSEPILIRTYPKYSSDSNCFGSDWIGFEVRMRIKWIFFQSELTEIWPVSDKSDSNLKLPTLTRQFVQK